MAQVRWLPWEKASFQKAKRQKKPVLLSISASWCHWCHNMDKLCYQHTGIAKTIHEKYIPVRIDTDQRPDVNVRYNMGGWPTTCVLTADGYVVLGATYIPPENMMKFLREGMKRQKDFQVPKRIKGKPMKTELVSFSKKILSQLETAFDPLYGGFGTEPKFPHPQALQFLMQSKSSKAKKMLTKTLDSMSKSQLWDKEEGGFYRYAMQQDWSTPHYEKLLEENMQLALVYLEAHKKTRKTSYKTIATKIIDFAVKVLFDKEGRFYGSQDADEEYCKLPIKFRKKRLPPAIDRTTYIPAQAITIIALKRAKIKKYDSVLKSALKFLESCRIGNLYGHYYDIEIRKPALAMDQLAALEVLLELNDITGAEKLVSVIIKNFGNSGLYDIVEDPKAAGELKHRRQDLEENSRWALALLELQKKTKKKKYGKLAESALQAVTPQAIGAGIFAATYAIAAEKSIKLNKR